MEFVFRVSLVIAGLINILPSLLAFIPSRISSSYGVNITDINIQILLQHRAILFGIVGSILLYAAITKRSLELAVRVGLVSMISFLILYALASGELNDQLTKVMYADVVAIGILVLGYGLCRFKHRALDRAQP